MFQKHFALALTTLILFVALGFYFTGFLMKSLMPKREMMPPVFIAKLVDLVSPEDKLKGVLQLEDLQKDSGRGRELVLLNAQGEVLYPKNFSLPFVWSQVAKPQKAYDFTRLDPDKSPPPSGPPLLPGLPGGMGGPGGPPHGGSALIRLAGEPAFYLYLQPHLGPPPGERPPMIFPFIGLISLVVSLLLGVGVAISLIYHSINKNVKLADHVLSELQRGNLKARFPVHRKDEFGQAMIRFNRMAEEIENLVDHLRAVETARTKLLQELAHDLRTPIASLKSLLETLDLKQEKLDIHVQKELMALSLQEVDYFERLVEDLLFLAQVNEPKYQSQRESLSVKDLLQEEGENCAFRRNQQEKKITLENIFPPEDIRVPGDLILIRRLFRNAFENAFSFSNSKVRVTLLKQNTGQVQIQIDDDGPGFSEESLKSFGERRLSRKLESHHKSRLSVGLGSVVMKTICQAHRGELKASNRTDTNGRVTGARIEILLPAFVSE